MAKKKRKKTPHDEALEQLRHARHRRGTKGTKVHEDKPKRKKWKPEDE